MPDTAHSPLAVAIIGSGFGGLGLLHTLKRAGVEDVAIFDKADALGGTWRENHYPGAGCDVPSHLYSFSFARHWPWSRRYARQAEILAYINHCADRFDLRRHVHFGRELVEARFDADAGLWTLSFADGSRRCARVLVSAVGQLSRPAWPAIPGREQFAGEHFHSAQWRHDVDLDGKTVAVIGTGASAVQFVPEIARRAARLHVYQRTPGWTLPKNDREYSPLARRLFRTLPWLRDLDRLRIFLLTEFIGAACRGNRLVERLILLFAWPQLRRVKDPAQRQRLTPDYPLGCKRLLLSNEWLPTLTGPKVELIDRGIARIGADGVVDGDGRHRAADVLIYGTGFAANDFLAPMRIIGRGGRSLADAWAQGAEAHLGISVAGFPNLYLLYGPNTNLASGSIIYMLECQQRYVTELITAQRAQGWRSIEVRAEVQAAFAAEMARRTEHTTIAGDCQSWYKNAEGRNTNNWVGSQREYARRTASPRLADFLIDA